MRPTRNGLLRHGFPLWAEFQVWRDCNEDVGGSERRVRLLRYNNLKRKSGNISLTQFPFPSHLYHTTLMAGMLATDSKSHTPVSNFYTRISSMPLPAIPMVDLFVPT